MNYSLTQIGKSNTVTLTPFTTNINLASETRRLFSEPIDERTSISKLYTTFQISRYVFTERIKRLNGDWENLHDYDIQSCFVYLKAIHELVTRDHLSIPSNIIEPINWLSHAIDNYPSKVDRAVKLKHAKQLIDFSKNLKSEEFIKLWNFALNEPNYFRKYQLMKSILLDFRALPTANMRETVVRRSHLTEAEIIKSMANTIYNKGEIEFAGYNSEIDWIIEQLNGIMVQISDNDERHKINQDIIVLSSI